MTRLAIFDLDGTLIDSRQDLCLAVNHALRTVGLPERSLEEVSAFIGKGARTLVTRSIAPHHYLIEPAFSAWHDYYQRHLLDHTVLYPGLQGVLAGARCLMAVHTNKPGAMARTILKGLGVASRFAVVLGGDEAPRKPDPAGTRQVMSQLGVSPDETIFVGDSPIDCETAAAAGVRLVAVTWGLASPETLRAAGAHDLLHKTSELTAWLQ